MALPHRLVEIAEPFRESYRNALATLAGSGIDCVITGDIDAVAGQPNWIIECSAGTGLEVLTPLWGRERLELLHEVLKVGFDLVVSCVKSDVLPADWVGRTLDLEALRELEEVASRTSLDVAGEQGEYHTIVLSGPGYRRPIGVRPNGVRQLEGLAFVADWSSVD